MPWLERNAPMLVVILIAVAIFTLGFDLGVLTALHNMRGN